MRDTKTIACRFAILHTIVLAFFLITTSCNSATSFTQTDRSLTIYIKKTAVSSPKWVYLEPVSSKIIRVVSGATAQPGFQKSLMRDTGSIPLVQWRVVEKQNEHILYTADLTVHINNITGELWFADKNDQPVLKETRGGGKSIISAGLPGDSLYRVSQQFESPEDEAIYGLGQPQTGILNYRNEDVDLVQNNSIVAVPFFVSSRNYGILWDNYSITRFGDNRPRRQLAALSLTGKDGKKGLTCTYGDRYDSSKIYLQQQEDSIDYAYLEDLKRIPAVVPMAAAKISWDGFITPDSSGTYKFYLSASGYLRFYLNGQLLFDKWREGWNPGPTHFKQLLKKGEKYAFKVEWIPESVQAFASLKFLPPQPAEDQNNITLSSEAGKNIDYYFIAGNNADDVIGGYRLLTGKATLVPDWALGFWQSRERYKTQKEIETTVEEYRKRKLGLDNIVLDWSFWKEDAWGSQQFDSSRFPDATGMISRLKKDYHTRFMISVWPKFYEGIPAYNYLDQHGWLYPQNIKNKQRDWIGKGYVSTFYDAFNPAARKAFWQLLDTSLFQKGVDAWWLDASEPDIYSNSSIAHRKALMEPNAAGSATAYFNGYPLVNAEAVYEGQRASRPDQRVFILTRSAYAGMQRYAAATWSGDIAARFDELQRQIPAGINFSLSGLPYWTSDIGGFFVEDKYDKPSPQDAVLEEWRELTTRWYQFGTFCPLFRSHGQFPYREIFNIAPDTHPAYKSMLFYNGLRYRLMPYIYSVAGSTYHNNYSIMRGLAMDFGNDVSVKNIGDQYMFGPALLISPVYTAHATNRNVYLPAGQGWYDLYTGSYTAGGQNILADAPYEKIPVFVKEGSIVPIGPALQYTREKPADDITLYVYTGKDAHFELYEDEGINYNYEKGNYSRIPFTYNEATRTLTIGKREGNFDGMLKERVFRIVWVNKNTPAALNFDRHNDDAVSYNGNEQMIKMNGNH